jgi:hypothetical protein
MGGAACYDPDHGIVPLLHSDLRADQSETPGVGDRVIESIIRFKMKETIHTNQLR